VFFEMTRTALMIPTFQCEGFIGQVIKAFTPEILKRLEYVCIYDNCSPDNTFANATKAISQLPNYSDKFRVSKNGSNLGLGGTFKKAFLEAHRENMDFMIVLHGDGQADTSEVTTFLNAIDTDPSMAAYLGSRFGRKSRRINYSLVRTYANFAFNAVFSILSKTRISDIGSGLNAYNLQRIDLSDVESLPNHIAFDAHLLLNLIERKLDFKFVPITWKEEGQASTTRNITVGLQVLKALFKWKFKT
jgi:dolichol-phosphate mannosyltransferase